MRFLRPALVLTLALAPAATATAEPYDGAERWGTPCQAALTSFTSPYYGVLAGGVYVVADLIANENGTLHPDPNLGLVDGVTLTCSVKKFSTTYATVTRASSDGLIVMDPQVLAFYAPSGGAFEVCTTLRWIDSEGSRSSESCGGVVGGL